MRGKEVPQRPDGERDRKSPGRPTNPLGCCVAVATSYSHISCLDGPPAQKQLAEILLEKEQKVNKTDDRNFMILKRKTFVGIIN